MRGEFVARNSTAGVPYLIAASLQFPLPASELLSNSVDSWCVSCGGATEAKAVLVDDSADHMVQRLVVVWPRRQSQYP